MNEEDVRRIVREELQRAGVSMSERKPRHAKPCGRGSAVPQCMGSAIWGPDGCTCPGVKIEMVEFPPRRYGP